MIGLFTREQAEGAMANGTRIKKVKDEPGDMMPIGATGTILGSVRHPTGGFRSPLGFTLHFYFVEWDELPGFAVGVMDLKIGLA